MSIIVHNEIIKPNKILYSYNVEYQNMNKDINLRKTVIKFFIKKLLKWIKYDMDFKKYNNNLDLINSKDGHKIIYKLIRKYINKYNANWYDLRTENYYLFKYYLNKNLKYYL